MSVSTQFLHTIQPVSEDRPAEAVAREILALIRSEYRYTIADLCRMFCCERQWIEDFFVPNIRHIHVNHFFMSYIIQQFADRLTPEEQSHLIHGHYFLSDADLGRFWRENASAGWFLILPNAACIFSAEAVFGISESISPLPIFYSLQAQKNRRYALAHRRYRTIDFFDCSARECARSPAGSA